MGQICQGNQNHIQQQDEGSRYQVEDQIFQTRKTEYSGFHDRVQGLSYEDRYRQITCNIFTKEEHIT